jgi:hypothetical protein
MPSERAIFLEKSGENIPLNRWIKVAEPIIN